MTKFLAIDCLWIAAFEDLFRCLKYPYYTYVNAVASITDVELQLTLFPYFLFLCVFNESVYFSVFSLRISFIVAVKNYLTIQRLLTLIQSRLHSSNIISDISRDR